MNAKLVEVFLDTQEKVTGGKMQSRFCKDTGVERIKYYN